MVQLDFFYYSLQIILFNLLFIIGFFFFFFFFLYMYLIKIYVFKSLKFCFFFFDLIIFKNFFYFFLVNIDILEKIIFLIKKINNNFKDFYNIYMNIFKKKLCIKINFINYYFKIIFSKIYFFKMICIIKSINNV